MVLGDRDRGRAAGGRRRRRGRRPDPARRRRHRRRRSRGRARAAADWAGVASTRTPSAARAAASRRRAPSPAIADHGQRRSSRSRSRSRWRSIEIVDQARTRSTVTSPGIRRDETGVGDDRDLGRRLLVRPSPGWPSPGARRRSRSRSARSADRGRRRARRPSRPAARRGSSGPPRTSSSSFRSGSPAGSPAPAAGARSSSPARSPGSTPGSIRASWSAIAPARITVSSGRRATTAGHDRGQLVEAASLVGAGRIARADEEDVDGRIEERLRQLERVHPVAAQSRGSASRSSGRPPRAARAPDPRRRPRRGSGPVRCGR